MNLGIRGWNKSKSEKPSFLDLSANLVSKRGMGQLAQVCRRITLRELNALRVNHNLKYCAAAMGWLWDCGQLRNLNFQAHLGIYQIQIQVLNDTSVDPKPELSYTPNGIAACP